LLSEIFGVFALPHICISVILVHWLCETSFPVALCLIESLAYYVSPPVPDATTEAAAAPTRSTAAVVAAEARVTAEVLPLTATTGTADGLFFHSLTRRCCRFA
jgi:hypothetical protein